jgi:hypothetical protein
VSEEMPVIAIVSVMIVNKNMRTYPPSFNYVPQPGMVIIMFVPPVRIRMITMVIFYPAIMVPAIAFPTSVPVFILVVIVFTVKLSIVSVVNHIS